MGAKFSSEAGDAQFLVRDNKGRLKIYQDTMDTAQKCNRLPIPLTPAKLGPGEQAVQYMFLPSTNYQGKNFHVHTYFDEECDTPGNDVVSPETVLKKKNVNHIKQSRISNSSYFDFNTDAINMPLYPSFTRKEDGIDMPRKAGKRAFSQCTLIPYPPNKDSPVSLFHNTVSLQMYTDDKCQNEFVNILPTPANVKDKYNVDDRDTPINDQTLQMRYTNVKSYIDPAIKTNAKYYRMTR